MQTTPDNPPRRANPTNELDTWANRCRWITSTGPKSQKAPEFIQTLRSLLTKFLNQTRTPKLALPKESRKVFRNQGPLQPVMRWVRTDFSSRFRNKMMRWLISRLAITWMAWVRTTLWTSLISSQKCKLRIRNRYLGKIPIRGKGPIQEIASQWVKL